MRYTTPQNLIVIVTISSIASYYSAAQLCEVRVPGRSWPAPVLVPKNSTVEINCTLTSSYWTIALANDAQSTERQFIEKGGQTELLNDHGVYELPESEYPGQSPTLRLLVNDTSENNGTKINCLSENNKALRTSIFVYEPLPLALEAVDAQNVSSISIKWDPSQFVEDHGADEIYELSVTSKNSDEELFITNTTSFTFTAPDNAPPCEVYNFSVTATPVGATYTGDGCSVPSPVLNRMLPSLPDIHDLESSLQYSLKKESNKMVLLTSFQPAKYCGDYPVANYTLVVESQVTPGWPETVNSTSDSAGNTLEGHDLFQDAIYLFMIVVHNSVGTVSTQGIQIYTTDVQGVRVDEGREKQDSALIRCDFIPGSDALGCVVILVGEVTNTTVMVDREDTTGVGVANTDLPLPLGCYHDVIAFDIEADGSNGTLHITGTLVRDTDDRVKCVPTKETPLKDNSKSLVEGIVVPVIAIMLIAITIAVVVILIFHVKLKRSRNSLDISPPGSLDGKVEEGPLYAFPVKVKKVKSKLRSEGDGAEISDKLDQENKVEADDTHQVCCLLNGNVNQGAAIDDDFMPDPDAPELPPPYNPDLEDSQACPIYDEIATKPSPKKSKLSNAAYPGPIYQDVLELSSSREDQAKLKGDVQQASHNAVGQDTLPVNPLPVYQDVAELTTEDAPLITGTSTLACPVLSSNTTRDLPPPIHVQPSDQRGLVIESSEGSCGMRLQATNVSTHTRSHPTTLPIYQHIADSAEVVANITCHDNVGNHYDTLGSPTTPPDTSSSTALTPYTPDPLPTPIYEDIDKVVSTVREETNTSVELSRPNDDSTSPETGDQTSSDKPTGTLV